MKWIGGCLWFLLATGITAFFLWFAWSVLIG
jgi:hypothetical protein